MDVVIGFLGSISAGAWSAIIALAVFILLLRQHFANKDKKNKNEEQADKRQPVQDEPVEKKATLLPEEIPVAPPPSSKILTSKLPTTGHDLFGREDELQILDDAWREPHPHVFTFVAWGGVGKTSLVNKWLGDMEKENYRGAARVYGWSFYSQGAGEGKQASADEFFDHALRWFGYEGEIIKSAWEKGTTLAELVRQERTLMILDGMEPLQYPPGEMEGRLKDQGVQALLKELSASGNGLCIVTTRLAVTDLEHRVDETVKEVQLEELSPKAGAALLTSLGVKGTDKELLAAAKEFKGHALALTLLGSYLTTAHEGDIRQRDLIPKLTEDEKAGGHARRVMESYEEWLKGKPEVDILYMLGLFDRPADAGAVGALREAPVIKGLTDALADLSEAKWNIALNHLRVLKLLADEERSDSSLDCHPLVREHFGGKLKVGNPDAWKEAHGRLYEYYRVLPEKERPDTLDEMQPLFAAVAHGCAAGLHQRALEEVYWERIKRKKEHYCTIKLGAFGSDLSVLASFFDEPWCRPTDEITEFWQAGVLGWAGFRLRALGRLKEAVVPFELALKMYIEQNKWDLVAMEGPNLSGLFLVIGEVKNAEDYARQCVEYADKSGVAFQKMINRSMLADTLQQAGNFDEAAALFVEAEKIQKERQPEYPNLYSLQGYLYCDFHLGKGEYKAVLERATWSIEIPSRSPRLLDMALDKLSLGRASLMKAKAEGGGFSEAQDWFNKAVAGLRDTGGQEFIVQGLLARAELWQAKGEFEKAEADLKEVFEIADRSGMRLFLTDYHLERARLCLDRREGDDGADAAVHFEKAKALVEETGYHRRDKEVEEIKGRLGL